MNTALELLFYETEDYDISIRYFPEEVKVRIYLNNHKFDTINLEVNGYENKRSEDNISQRHGIGQQREAPV
jgi:hypothetical protein